MVPRENKNNAYAKFGGTNKEYYGIFRTGLYSNYRFPVLCDQLKGELKAKKYFFIYALDHVQ